MLAAARGVGFIVLFAHGICVLAKAKLAAHNPEYWSTVSVLMQRKRSLRHYFGEEGESVVFRWVVIQ